MPRRTVLQSPRWRLADVFSGPLPTLPRPVDRAADWWAGRPPRIRALVLALTVITTLAATEARVRSTQRQWGGAPVTVLVATRDLGVGEAATDLRRVRLPPRAVPPGAVTEADAGAALAVGLPEGGVLTAAHVDARGPGASLAAGLRAVPIPIEDGWGIVAGAFVDVWLLGDTTRDGRLVARSRPVLEVADENRPTALVGLAEAEVELVTEGLHAGLLLLAHAPPSPVGD